MTSEYKKPLPRGIHPEMTKPFWEAAKRHELGMPRCHTCGHYFFYPRQECPECLSRDWEYEKVSGKAHLYTFNINHSPANPNFRNDVPFVYAVVQLEEGPQMISNVVDCPLDQVKIDMSLVATFDDVTPEWTLVKFKPA